VELSGVVPLPISVADDRAAAFLPLAAAPPLARIVAVMLDVLADPGRVVIAAAESLIGDVHRALASLDLASVNVVAVSAPGDRADCLRAAVEYLGRASFSTSHVLVHDISRPLASPELVNRVVAAMRSGETVVMPILAVTDSVKAVDVHGSITATVDRSVLRTIQYPRGFAVGALNDLLAQDTDADFDEMAMALGAGGPIAYVEGDPDAFRADLPRDAEFIEAIIASRRPDPHDA
jgi:2-C-methyl-D-erythritol 4-phosphate cytidylyltransferase